MWKITKIDTAAKRLTVVHKDGRSVTFDIPVAHRGKESSAAFVLGHTDGHDSVKEQILKFKKESLILKLVVVGEFVALLLATILVIYRGH